MMTHSAKETRQQKKREIRQQKEQGGGFTQFEEECERYMGVFIK